MKELLKAGVCTAVLVWSVQAGAQAPTTAEQPAAPAAQDDGALSEVVVTAQRRAERLQAVPIAVTALSGKELQSEGIASTADLPLVTPGLQLKVIAGFTLPSIRGVGANAQGPGLENPVGIYVDGVYLAASSGSVFSLDNVEQVEVLKGPQGTLFGRNSTGGVIQVTTADPKQELGGKITLGYGNYNTGSVDGYITGGLSDTVAADFALHYKSQGDGYGKDLYDGHDILRTDDDLAMRSKIKWEPSDTTTFVTALDYSYLKSSALTVLSLSPDDIHSSIYNNVFLAKNLPNYGGYYDINQNTPPLGQVRAYGISVEAQQEIGELDLKSITAARNTDYHFKFDIDATPAYFFSLQAVPKAQQVTEELQLSSTHNDVFKWTTGIYYFHAEDSYEPYIVDFGPSGRKYILGLPPAITSATDTLTDRQLTDSTAAYGQGTYEILPATHLTFGARYTHETKVLTGGEAFDLNGFPASVTPVTIPDHKTYNNFSYRVALDYQFTDNILGYLSYNTGFKSGGYNLSVLNNPAYNPETIKSVAGGLKMEFLDHRVRVNIEGYRYSYKNIQVSTYSGTSQIVYNGAGAEIYGFDLDSIVRVAPDLTINGSLSFAHDRFTDFPLADYSYLVPGCNFSNPSPNRVCQASANGNQLVNTPPVTATIGFSYFHPLWKGGLEFNGNLYYSDQYFGSVDNNPQVVQKAYTNVNLSLAWSPDSEDYKVTLWGKNIFSEQYATSVLISGTGINHLPAPPATFGANFTYNF